MSDEEQNVLSFIPTSDLKGKRFIFSARQRAARAAEAAYYEWVGRAGRNEDPIRQECWSYVIDHALKALTDGEER